VNPDEDIPVPGPPEKAGPPVPVPPVPGVEPEGIPDVSFCDTYAQRLDELMKGPPNPTGDFDAYQDDPDL
jgi:hypothetical protein